MADMESIDQRREGEESGYLPPIRQAGGPRPPNSGGATGDHAATRPPGQGRGVATGHP